MEQGEDMAAMGHAAMADCCNDAETAAKTGKQCKTNQSCSASPLVMIFSAPTWHFVATDRNAALNTTVSVPTVTPTDLWRPPTLS